MNKVTERRLKLFEDAEHYGAEVFENGKWKCAVCRTYDQTHCFGRAKPKVLSGTNDIDEAANLRDDEGISPEKRRLRDSGSPWVKDGLSREMDSQPFEAGWCVMGGNGMYQGSTLEWGPGLRPCSSYAHVSVYCNGAAPGEVCPLLVFLELDTGKLYISNLQFSRHGMMPLGGGWCVSDFNCELNGYTEGGIRKRILSDKPFAEIYQSAAEKSLDGMTGAVKVDVVGAAKTIARPASPTGMTVLDAYEAMRSAGCTTGMSMFVKADGVYIPVAGITEGLGSSVILTAVQHKRAIRVSEFVEYSKRHAADDPLFKFRKFEIKVRGTSLEPKDTVGISGSRCVFFV